MAKKSIIEPTSTSDKSVMAAKAAPLSLLVVIGSNMFAQMFLFLVLYLGTEVGMGHVALHSVLTPLNETLLRERIIDCTRH